MNFDFLLKITSNIRITNCIYFQFHKCIWSWIFECLVSVDNYIKVLMCFWFILKGSDFFNVKYFVCLREADNQPPYFILTFGIILCRNRLLEHLYFLKIFFFSFKRLPIDFPFQNHINIKWTSFIIRIEFQVYFVLIDNIYLKIWVPIANLSKMNDLILLKFENINSLWVIHIHKISNIFNIRLLIQLLNNIFVKVRQLV